MLRRTPFRSKAPGRRPTTQYGGANPSAPRAQPVCIADGRARLVHPIEKEEIVRSGDYRRFVAAQPCFDCGVEGWSQCAHENVNKAMSRKVCDLRTFPLCAPRYGLVGCHQQFDLGMGRGRELRRLLGRQWVERMQRIAKAAGRKEFK